MKRLFLCFMLVLISFSTPAFAASGKAYDKDFFGETEVYKAVFEDTLIHLARNNELGFVELRAANPTLDPWIPGAGARIVLPKQHILPEAPRKGIVINLAEMRIYYFKTVGKEPLTFPISIGREGLQTPTGTTKIVRKKKGPSWRPTPRMRKEDPKLPAVVPAGPENPLGTHAMYLGWAQYAMHGTNKPYGIGRRVSSGCIRMYPEHIVKLFPQVPVGTMVSVVDQPVKVGWIDSKMYIEVSPTQNQSVKIEEDGVLKSYEVTTAAMKRISRKAGIHADKIDWRIVRKAVQEHRGYPVQILDINRGKSRRAEQELNNLLDQADSNKKDAQEIRQAAQKEQVAEVKVDKKKENVKKVKSSSSPRFND